MLPARPSERVSTEVTARAHLRSFRRLPEVLERFGLRADPLLRSVGFAREDFDDPDRTATFAELDRLLGLVVTRTQCPHVGLMLGESIDLEVLGLTGRLVDTAATVGDALQDLARYFLLHDTGGVSSVAVNGQFATFSYGIHVVGFRHAAPAYDFAAVVMLNIMKQLCGREWRPLAVLLPRRKPEVLRPYRILEAPVRFDAAQTSVQFESSWLSTRTVGADPLLHSLLLERVTSDSSRTDPLFENSVRRVIRQRVLAGPLSREKVALQLGLHPRTMVRRLTDCGSSYQALLDETRAHVAKQLLHETRSPVSRIASSLGYRDPAVFSRAFRRWTGVAPRAFREAMARSHRT